MNAKNGDEHERKSRYKLTPHTHRLPSLIRFTNPIEPAREDSKSRSLGKEIGSKLIESYKLKRLPRDRDAKQKIQKAIESKL